MDKGAYVPAFLPLILIIQNPDMFLKYTCTQTAFSDIFPVTAYVLDKLAVNNTALFMPWYPYPMKRFSLRNHMLPRVFNPFGLFQGLICGSHPRICAVAWYNDTDSLFLLQP